jgi:hypothetical protein
VYDSEETIRRITPEPQADMRRLSLRNLQVSTVLNAGPDAVLPAPTNPGTKTRVASDVIQLNSRTVAAGARIVLIADAVKPIQDSAGQIAMVERPGGYIVAEPAAFGLVADGASVSDSTTPVYRAMLDRSTAPTYSFRTVLSRRDQKSWMNGELEDGVLMSILCGLGRLVDQVLLNAVVAATPPAFTIGAAAARGLKIEQLSGLVGTSGDGAGWRGDGEFCAAGGIRADLTGDMAGTIVGDFGRAAVGLFEDIVLIGQRTSNANGDMAVTCHANAQALLPVTAALLPFWTVSA